MNYRGNTPNLLDVTGFLYIADSILQFLFWSAKWCNSACVQYLLTLLFSYFKFYFTSTTICLRGPIMESNTYIESFNSLVKSLNWTYLMAYFIYTQSAQNP